jgi:hypothetical protein
MGTAFVFFLKHSFNNYIYEKWKALQKNVKTISGIFALSNYTTFSQSQTVATVLFRK